VAIDGHEDSGALAAALARVGHVARGPDLVAVVSDLRGQLGWRGPLRALAHRHSVVAIEVRDPREGELPDVGHLVLVDPETGRHVEADTSSARLRRRYAEAEAERRAAVAAELRTAGAEHLLVSTEGSWLRELGRALR
jgi:uncharacterized protein (DUF58 family)